MPKQAAPDQGSSALFVNLKEDMMAHITRYDPFETDALDNLFRGFFRPGEDGPGHAADSHGREGR